MKKLELQRSRHAVVPKMQDHYVQTFAELKKAGMCEPVHLTFSTLVEDLHVDS